MCYFAQLVIMFDVYILLSCFFFAAIIFTHEIEFRRQFITYSKKCFCRKAILPTKFRIWLLILFIIVFLYQRNKVSRESLTTSFSVEI